MRALAVLLLAGMALLQGQAPQPAGRQGLPSAIPKVTLPSTSPLPFTIRQGPEFPGMDLRRSPILLRRDDGRFVLAWETLNPAKQALGEAALYDEQLRLAAGPVATTNPRVDFFESVHEAVTFANGNVLIAFNERDNRRVSLGLFDGRMRPLKGLAPLSPLAVDKLVLTRLAGGHTAAAVYFDGLMRMAVINDQGEFVLPPKPIIGDIHSDRVLGLAGATLPNGLILVAYAPPFLTTALLDPLGNNVREPKRLPNNLQVTGLSVVPAGEDRAVIGFIDTRNSKYLPTLAFVNGQGDPTGGNTVLWQESANWMRPVRLDNGQLFALIDPAFPDPDRGLGIVRTDMNGTIVAGPTLIEEGHTFVPITQALVALPGGKALVFLSGFNGDIPQKKLRTAFLTIQ